MTFRDWATLAVAFANLILRVWEMRRARRENDETDPEDR
jgi:hypothetical protein